MTRRRLLLLACTGLLALPAGLPAAATRASRPEVRDAVVQVVADQLAAFRRGDPPAAYRQAAAAFRAQRSLEAFVAIVRDRYPEIWANVRAEPGIVRDDGTRATVTFQVYSEKGDAAYDYSLVRESAGWRIFGVVRHEPVRRGRA